MGSLITEEKKGLDYHNITLQIVFYNEMENDRSIITSEYKLIFNFEVKSY